MGVITYPGATVLTRIPFGASSTAAARPPPLDETAGGAGPVPVTAGHYDRGADCTERPRRRRADTGARPGHDLRLGFELPVEDATGHVAPSHRFGAMPPPLRTLAE